MRQTCIDRWYFGGILFLATEELESISPPIASFQETTAYLRAHYAGVEPFIRTGMCFYTFDDRHSIFEVLLGAQIIVAIASEAFCFVLAYRMFNVLRKRANVLSKTTYRQQKQFNVMLLSDVSAGFSFPPKMTGSVQNITKRVYYLYIRSLIRHCSSSFS